MEPESPTKLKPSLPDPMSVWANTKKALYQILWKRLGCASISGSRKELHDCDKTARVRDYLGVCTSSLRMKNTFVTHYVDMQISLSLYCPIGSLQKEQG